MTFGTFDYFHPGHVAYLREAAQRGDRLITIVALDATVQQLKEKTPHHDHTTRKKEVAASGIADLVLSGDPADPYSCLRDYTPDIICLGYDQAGFATGIQEFYNQSGHDQPHIVRCAPYLPEQHKSSHFHA